jgi:hypothetical protein
MEGATDAVVTLAALSGEDEGAPPGGAGDAEGSFSGKAP